MAVNVKISNLPPATTPLTGAELMPVVQGGVTKKVAVGGTIPAAQILNTPAGTVAATNVQSAINEIVSDLAASSGSSLVGHIAAGSGAVVRTVQSKLRDVVSVKDFGAVGDGVTDDTVAITNAVNYIKSVGGILDFPEGEFINNASHTIDADAVVLRGVARWGRPSDPGYNTGTIIKHTQNLASPMFTFAAPTGKAASNGCGVTNIAFISGNNNRAYSCPAAIYVQNADHFTLSGLMGSQFKGSLLKCSRSVQSYFENINAYKCGSTGNPAIHLEAVALGVQNSTFVGTRAEVCMGGEPFIHIQSSGHGQNKWFGIGCETDPVVGEDTSGSYLYCQSQFNAFYGLTGNNQNAGGSNAKFNIGANRCVVDGVQGAGGAVGPLLYVTGSYHTISNVLFNGDGVTGGDKYAVHIQSGTNTTVSNITAQNGQGVYIANGVVGANVSNITVNTATNHGVYVDGLRCTVSNAIVNDTATGIHFGPNSEYCRIVHSMISGTTGRGIYLQGVAGARHQARGNHVFNAGTHGIHVTASKSAISGNYINQTAQHGIFIDECQPVDISGNEIFFASTGNANTYSGLRLASAATSFADGAIISGNKFEGTDTLYDIQIDNNFDYLVITSNNAQNGKETSSLGTGANNVVASNIEIP